MNGQAPLPLRILGRLIGLAIIVTGIAAAVMAARTSSGNPRTDDAYVSANVIGIAPHVQGPLVQLNVVDNQPVEADDLLFVIDPRPYEAELQRAQGELIIAQAEVSGIEQAIAAGRAEVTRLQADTAYARTHAGRLEPLLGGRFISADQYQEAVTKARSLDAAVQHAQSQLAQQEKLLAQQGDVNGRLETAKARVRLAGLNVEYCYVRAPFKGLVTNLNISLGDYAHVGERVFALVDRRMWYVLGNFRETLLPAIEPGMEARVNLVGYPGRTFHGVVQGIAWSVLARVDLERKLIAYDRPGRQATKKRRAVVPINVVALAELQSARMVAVSDYVIEFRGKPVASIKTGFRAACRRAGIAECSPHTLRHSSATHMVMAGVPMIEIARMMGDTVAMVEQVYGKHSSDFLRNAADALAGNVSATLSDLSRAPQGKPRRQTA